MDFSFATSGNSAERRPLADLAFFADSIADAAELAHGVRVQKEDFVQRVVHFSRNARLVHRHANVEIAVPEGNQGVQQQTCIDGFRSDDGFHFGSSSLNKTNGH